MLGLGSGDTEDVADVVPEGGVAVTEEPVAYDVGEGLPSRKTLREGPAYDELELIEHRALLGRQGSAITRSPGPAGRCWGRGPG